jgi:hypothetical protein
MLAPAPASAPPQTVTLAAHSAAPVAPRVAVVRPAPQRVAEPTIAEPTHAPAKVAAVAPAKAKDLFSDPD